MFAVCCRRELWLFVIASGTLTFLANDFSERAFIDSFHATNVRDPGPTPACHRESIARLLRYSLFPAKDPKHRRWLNDNTSESDTSSVANMSNVPKALRKKGGVGDVFSLELSEDAQQHFESSPGIEGELIGRFQVARGSLRFKTCAVVGSGGSLHGKGLGAVIDGHDVVMRMNHHIADPKQINDTGCKTTFLALHSNNAAYAFEHFPNLAKFVTMPILLEHAPHSRPWLECFLSSLDTCPCMLQKLNVTWRYFHKRVKKTDFERKVNGRNLHRSECILGTEFRAWRDMPWAFLRESMVPVRRCAEAARLGSPPSSGFRLVALGLYFCEQVSVFGMADNTNRYDSAKDGRNYFQIHRHHNFRAEHKWYEDLRERSLIAQPDWRPPARRS